MIHVFASAAVLFAAGAAAAAPVAEVSALQGPSALQGAAARADAPDARAPNPSVFDAVSPLPGNELGALNGGQAVTGAFSNTALTELNSGNSITAGTVVSGGVSLGSNAFNGFDGLGNFVINTGNNNNLQGSLTVTVVMAPGLTR